MKLTLKLIAWVWGITFLSFFGLQFYVASGAVLPPEAQYFVSKFHDFLDAFLTSYWFFIIFVLGWFGVIYAMSKKSGWSKIATMYANNFVPPLNAKFKTGSGYIGNVGHNGILKIYVDESGMYLKVLLLFKFGHKDLFIPWQDIATVKEEKGLVSTSTPKFIKIIIRALSSSTYINIELKNIPDKSIVVPWIKAFDNTIPNFVKRDT